MKKIFLFSVSATVLFFASCKQQQIVVNPGAVVSKDGTDDGLKNVKSEFEDASRTSEGIKFTLSSDLLFPTNSSYLTDKAKVELTKLSKLMKEDKTKKIRVDGYTDATGTEEYNVWLSDKRAASVKKYLEEAGVSGGRISTKGFGPSKPVGDNKTPEGRQKNRRVEVTILQ
ncbi:MULTISPECIES: OmpA family protein [Sphingobacterium]|uniref:OmpA family protein n=1 Tax=Sphingobacterium TaxID=28453 RepID=UPI0013DD2D3B|nr:MULTISPECIES: OmpA family protein [unclassified Sphingobacterium]